MMDVKVLGTGCAKCNQLYRAAQQAIEQAGVQAALTKVEDIPEIMKYGIMMTPALVINEAVMSVGKVPKVSDISAWLREMDSVS